MVRPRHIVLRLVAVLFGLGLALVVAELGLRLTGWPGTPLVSGRLQTPHSSRPSRPDFRDRVDPLATGKRPGVPRLVVVGDSFTWGVGVLAQDAYADRMGEILERRARAAGAAAPAAEVVNFSRPGWNATQELAALSRDFERLAPDGLIVGYCLNDAEPHRRRELLALREGVNPRHPESAVERFLWARSALFRVAFQRWDNLRMRRATTAYYHRFYVDGQPTWEATRSALRQMRDLAAGRSIPMLLVVFPIFDSQLDERYAYRELHRVVAAAAEEDGIDLLDLLSRYRGVDARRLAIDPFFDSHPSELAHRIAAEAILEAIQARGWLGLQPVDRGGSASPGATPAAGEGAGEPGADDEGE